MSLKAN